MLTNISRLGMIQIYYLFVNDSNGPEILTKHNITCTRKSRPFHNLRGYCCMFFPLRIDAAHPSIVCDPVNSQHVGRRPSVHRMRVGITAEIVKAGYHRILEPFIHDVLAPKITHSILHPFEVRNLHAAGIGHDVSNYEDALLVQNLIAGRGGWAFRSFTQNLAL